MHLNRSTLGREVRPAAAKKKAQARCTSPADCWRRGRCECPVWPPDTEPKRHIGHCSFVLVRASLLCAALVLASCNQIPRDTEGSLERIGQEGRFRVGLISGSPDVERRGNLLLDHVAKAAGARPVGKQGAAEPLLQELEEGRLDLIVGAMADKSPWRTRVHFLPPLGSKGGAKPSVVAMVRNGENAWISLLHREAEKVGKLP